MLSVKNNGNNGNISEVRKLRAFRSQISKNYRMKKLFSVFPFFSVVPFKSFKSLIHSSLSMPLSSGFASAAFCAFCGFCPSSYLRANASETDEGASYVLIFTGAPSRFDETLWVFPRTTTHRFLLQCVWVFLGCVVVEFWVHIAHGEHTSLSEDGRCPLCHISCHIVKTVGIG